jgi:hypothetical protein
VWARGEEATDVAGLGSLAAGDRRKCFISSSCLAAARDWCREHPADPAVEEEIVARCQGWSAARCAEGSFRFIDKSLKYGDKFRPFADQDSALSEQIGLVETFLKRYPEDARARARQDKEFRAALAKALLLRAGVCALRAAGLEERGGTPQELEPVRAENFRRIAFNMLEQAVRESGVTRERLEAEQDLKGLRSDERWAKLVEAAGK